MADAYSGITREAMMRSMLTPNQGEGTAPGAANPFLHTNARALFTRLGDQVGQGATPSDFLLPGASVPAPIASSRRAATRSSGGGGGSSLGTTALKVGAGAGALGLLNKGMDLYEKYSQASQLFSGMSSLFGSGGAASSAAGAAGTGASAGAGAAGTFSSLGSAAAAIAPVAVLGAGIAAWNSLPSFSKGVDPYSEPQNWDSRYYSKWKQGEKDAYDRAVAKSPEQIAKERSARLAANAARQREIFNAQGSAGWRGNGF